MTVSFLGHRLVKDLQRKHIIALHNAKAATPDAANSLLELLRSLIRLALDLDLVGNEPSTGFKRLKSKNPDGHYTWSEPDIDRFEARRAVKFGLLRALAEGRAGVVWYRFPDEGHNSDGRHVAYLSDQHRWCSHDPDLFDSLGRLVGDGRRSVTSIEKS